MLDRANTSPAALLPYLQIARIDNWSKNVFMVFGAVFAFFYRPELFHWRALAPLSLGLAATCLIASSNYVLNELLDGPHDAMHPAKRSRPVPSGRVRTTIAFAEWIGLALAGLGLAVLINRPFALMGLSLWVMGVAYNVPPLRTKEWPYLDVLSESVNNPLRLLLGWFALVNDRVPPLSLVLSYWMVGAFFMGAKRLAEYRHIAQPSVAAAYRKSFAHYTEERLLVSLFFYATTCALFAGIFIVRYHVELILIVPIAAALFAYYLHIALQPNSAAQYPERLYGERTFVLCAVLTVALFIGLLFIRIPALSDLFNVGPSTASHVDPLWTIGPEHR